MTNSGSQQSQQIHSADPVPEMKDIIWCEPIPLSTLPWCLRHIRAWVALAPWNPIGQYSPELYRLTTFYIVWGLRGEAQHTSGSTLLLWKELFTILDVQINYFSVLVFNIFVSKF